MKNLSAIFTVAIQFAIPLYAGAATPDPQQDEDYATELQRKVDQGDGDAALQIGNLLIRSRIPGPRYGTPITWFKKGCTLRSLPACHNVGVSYEQGRNGVNQDYAEATSYFLQAAERAFLPSMYNLAVLSAESKISAADNREGLKWMLVAQKSAVQCPESPTCKTVTDDPKGYRKQLESRLSSKEIRETYKLADDWRPRN
jgi:TPR repeat protein